MTGKRFKVTDNTDNPCLCDWSVTDYADGGIVHHPMTSENMANVMCELLNELHEEKELWKRECKRLKGLYYLENENVELEDIIGLVKTDEQTNSVELKKELYKG